MPLITTLDHSNTLNGHTRTLSLVLTAASWDSSPGKTCNKAPCCHFRGSQTAPKQHVGAAAGLLSFAEPSTKLVLCEFNTNTNIKLFLLNFSLIQQACPQIPALKTSPTIATTKHRTFYLTATVPTAELARQLTLVSFLLCMPTSQSDLSCFTI